MSQTLKSVSFAIALVAIVAPLVLVDYGTQAQKTIANSFQQTVSSGSSPNSVYGGYQTSNFNRRQSSSSLVAPVNQQRRTQQTYISRSQTNTAPQPVYQQQQQVVSSSSSSSYEQQQAEADAEPASYGSVQGQAGVDFPNYARVPKTSFSCEGLPYDYGMYADEETGCQAYHVCYNGRKDSFLCGPGTVFNQRILHCDYWYSVDCGKSSQYYGINAYMGSSQPEPGPAQAGVFPPPAQQSSYKRTEISSTSINRPVSVQRVQSGSSFRNTQQQYEDSY